MKELFNAIKQKAIELGFELDFYHLEDDLNEAIKPELTVNFRHLRTTTARREQNIMAVKFDYSYNIVGIEYKNESDSDGWSLLELQIMAWVSQRNKSHLFETQITASNSESGINVEVL